MSHPIKNPCAPLTGGIQPGILCIPYINRMDGSPMNIIISNANDKPIYEQICTQIKNAVLAGALRPGDALPSIRSLAKDLRVSVITTKRAYDELEKDGYLYTVPGKGCYVAEKNTQLVREAYLTQIEEHMTKILSLAAACGLTADDLAEMLRLLAQNDP